MPDKRKSLSETERDIQVYQNDRSPIFDRGMYDQPEEEQIITYTEPSAYSPEDKQYQQSRGFSSGGMCRGGGKAIRGMKFEGVK